MYAMFVVFIRGLFDVYLINFEEVGLIKEVIFFGPKTSFKRPWSDRINLHTSKLTLISVIY